MVSLRNGRIVNNDGNAKTSKSNPSPRSQKAATKEAQQSPFIKGKKRKARDPSPAGAEAEDEEKNEPAINTRKTKTTSFC